MPHISGCRLLPGHTLASGDNAEESQYRGPAQETQSVGNGQKRDLASGVSAHVATKRGRVEEQLGNERPVVEDPIKHEEVGTQSREEEERAQEAEPGVRDGLKPESVLKRIQEPTFTGEELELPGDRSHLPRKLLPGRTRGPVVRKGAALKKYAITPGGDPHRDQDVVDNRVVRDG